MRRCSVVLPVCLLVLAAAAAPGLGVSQGNGFRWFWRGSTGGSTTHKFSFSSRGGSTTGSHSMVVVRVKDSNGRTVMLDPANPHTSRRVVQGISGKGANKSSFTLTKTVGGITPGSDPLPPKPSKRMQPPPVTPTEAATTPAPPSGVENLLPSRWFRAPRAQVNSEPNTFRPADNTPKPTFQPQLSAKLILTRPTSKPAIGYLPPSAPQTNGILTATTARPVVKTFRMTPPKEVSGPSAPAPTPTPASHVAKDIRRNLSGRVDGSVFFGILPVVNDLQRAPQAKTEPPPKIVISRRAGKCPFINMMRCAAPSRITRGRCSNDNQCPTERRCCYNPCAASSQCMAAVL